MQGIRQTIIGILEENVHGLRGELVTTNMGKAEILNRLHHFSVAIFLLTSLKTLNLRAGTGEQSPFHHKRQSGSRPLAEPEHIHGTQDISQSPEGIG